MTKMPPITPYGVPIREIIATGDRELLAAMSTLSEFMMQKVREGGAQPDAEWREAHSELKRLSL